MRCQEGNSDKVYEVDLIETAAMSEEKYLVNFRYGRYGSTLREGSKTAMPVPFEQAEKIFDSVVISKHNKGYVSEDDSSGEPPRPSPTVSSAADHTDAPTAAYTDALLTRIKNEKHDPTRSRQIWRLSPAPHPEAAALITDFLQANNKHHDWRDSYSILWTLGRIGSSSDIKTVTSYLNDSNPVIASLALEVMLALTAPDQRQATYQAHCPSSVPLTPDTLQQHINAFCHEAAQQKRIGAPVTHPINAVLKEAYLQSWFNPEIKRTLLALLPDIPFSPGAFKGLRYLLKMSEFRLDREMQPLINIHLEASAPHFNRQWMYHYSGHGRLEVSKELASDNARLAHSQHTHRYFTARFSRTLKQLGIANSPLFTVMAEHTLLQYTDDHAKAPRTFNDCHYDRSWQRHLTRTRHYDGYAHCSALNTLLHTHAPHYRKNARGIWQYDPNETFTGRGEAFPHLWDNAPDALLRIACHTRCQPVADFSVRALRDNSMFCAGIPLDALITLLLKPYDSLQQFALQQLRRRGSDTPLPDHIICQLFLSPSDDVITFALAELDKIRDFSHSVPLLSTLLCLDHAALRAWLDTLSQRLAFTAINPAALLTATIRAITDQHATIDSGGGTHTETEIDIETETDTRTPRLSITLPSLADVQGEWLFQWIQSHCEKAISQLDVSSVEALIQHPSAVVRLLGCRLLDAMPISYSQITESTLQAIERSSSKAIQAFSLALLKKLAPEQLSEKVDYLIGLLPQCGPDKQAAILSVIATAISAHKPSRPLIFQHIVHQLHTRDLANSLQQLLLLFLSQHFDSALAGNKNNGLWQLATARSAMAQSLAADYLAADRLSAEQWFSLLSSPTLSLRKQARTYFSHQPDALLGQMDSILQVLESPWPDTQSYGFTFCREHLTKEDWQPDQIIAVCDSVVEPVQQYGRELIQTYFDADDGPQYMLQLSQHPAANVELFVSQLLPLYAAGDSDMIVALQPYFLSVLSRVNAGRVTKDRVIAFLQENADTSPQTLEMTCALLTRLSLTSVQKDKSAYLKLMLDLASRHDANQTELPIHITPRPTTSPRRMEE
ncbi:hypothetical protein GCM10007086_27020 [Photobacterium aphoticum]|uniref:WGR domain-containing protein n=1 Tax=Photobacterium aphoticum TaxID=754436 RepID=A0A0J1GGP7_9GAMM|nr:hypothetical protein ABT58_21160 [Photobacterium aphoticum]PSU55997.1 hypothetical protein C9I90_14415 [Photobacterium aphoticum]GHA51741.1 hypothetical protein GCM10007086_27020 [Photobacterium aphoticum]